MRDIDIYRSASLLIQQHGRAAPIQAAMQADRCLMKGDMDGRAVWLRIKKAVEALQDQAPRPPESLH